MQINELKISRRKPRKKIGRGGKRGTYSGRGMKGQKSRSGGNINPLFEGGRSSLIERLKKVKGFKSHHLKKMNVNLDDLESKFKNADVVSTESLIKSGLVDRLEAKGGIKILGGGKISKKLTISKNILLTQSARDSILKAGGKIDG